MWFYIFQVWTLQVEVEVPVLHRENTGVSNSCNYFMLLWYHSINTGSYSFIVSSLIFFCLQDRQKTSPVQQLRGLNRLTWLREAPKRSHLPRPVLQAGPPPGGQPPAAQTAAAAATAVMMMRMNIMAH